MHASFRAYQRLHACISRLSSLACRCTQMIVASVSKEHLGEGGFAAVERMSVTLRNGVVVDVARKTVLYSAHYRIEEAFFEAILTLAAGRSHLCVDYLGASFLSDRLEMYLGYAEQGSLHSWKVRRWRVGRCWQAQEALDRWGNARVCPSRPALCRLLLYRRAASTRAMLQLAGFPPPSATSRSSRRACCAPSRSFMATTLCTRTSRSVGPLGSDCGDLPIEWCCKCRMGAVCQRRWTDACRRAFAFSPQCANVLVTSKGHVRLADFGLARRLEGRAFVAQSLGTPGLRAPEVLKKRLGPKADAYSTGAMLMQLCLRLPDMDQFDGIAEKLVQGKEPDFPVYFPAPLAAFIRDLCAPDPASRPRAAQALAHPYLAECAGLADADLTVTVA